MLLPRPLWTPMLLTLICFLELTDFTRIRLLDSQERSTRLKMPLIDQKSTARMLAKSSSPLDLTFSRTLTVTPQVEPPHTTILTPSNSDTTRVCSTTSITILVTEREPVKANSTPLQSLMATADPSQNGAQSETTKSMLVLPPDLGRETFTPKAEKEDTELTV